MKMSVWIGFDPRPSQFGAFHVARQSVRKHMAIHWPIKPVVLKDLREQGLYTRPTEYDADGHMIDVLSKREDYDGRVATEFANSRFLVPFLAPEDEWCVFMDCDMLVRASLDRLRETLDRSKALYCVQHDYTPKDTVKMDGQLQTNYPRKNWSSFMFFNPHHPSNRKLTLEMINSLPGRDLHRFCWLDDSEIGRLDESWNWLPDHSDPDMIPNNVHYTDALPNLPGHENRPYADEWRAVLYECVR